MKYRGGRLGRRYIPHWEDDKRLCCNLGAGWPGQSFEETGYECRMCTSNIKWNWSYRPVLCRDLPSATQACHIWTSLPGQYLSGSSSAGSACHSEADAKGLCLQTPDCGGINKQPSECGGTKW